IMIQRYKVFFNDWLLSISTADEAICGVCKEIIDHPDRKSVGELIAQFEDSGIQTYCVCHKDPEDFFKMFISFYQIIEAAGGIVRHPSGKYLFIKRFGKWDLPKGKIEKGESPELAALREVREECGIADLKINNALPSTYHTYKLEGNRVLKKTWWFAMDYTGNLFTKPQTEEGITEASWLVPSQFDMVLENTYRSIAELIGDVSWNTGENRQD
ncbi:MAG: NUDIX domain-containing protein, partial [Bacteroidia bacterium]|nr:NUDIX domain-containing protein [Bacteroidia bacterium]